MIIQHNIMAINSHRQLGMNNTNLSKNLEKLSSGYRINRAADDAAGLSISEKMRAQIVGLERAAMNAQDANSLIGVAEGAMTEIHSMLNRLKELATQSANGIYEDDGTDRKAIQAEVDAIIEEIDRIGDATKFNDLNLLDGTWASTAQEKLNFQIGDTADTWNVLNVTIESVKADDLGLKPSNANINLAKQADASTALGLIKTAINKVSTERGKLGAVQNRLDHTINNLGSVTENMTAAESRIRDVDMAKEMMGYTKNSILVQSAQAMLAQANQQPQNVLQLLR